MDRDRYDSYIARFNAEDPTAFDDFITPDMVMLNGALTFRGVAGMRHHYENLIWPHFVETLNVEGFVSSDDALAVRLWTRFTAKHHAETLFGPVREGETFDYRGVVFYTIRDGRFDSITVAYNSFINTKTDGSTRDMGMPH